MYLKTLLRLFSLMLILSMLTLVRGYPVVAEQDSLSLYSYFMHTYSKEYVDIAVVEEKLKELQSKYQVIKQNNLQAESFQRLKEYAAQVESDINSKIDQEVVRLQQKQQEVAKKIEAKLTSSSPKELSILNREYSKYQENIDESLANKTSMVSLFQNPTYSMMDSSSIERDIQHQVTILGTNSNGEVNLGNIDNLRVPFAYNRVVTSPAGYRVDPFDGTIRFHSGTDYAMPEGIELFSLFNGTVIESDDGNGVGLGEHIKIDCGNGIVVVYGHMKKRYVNVGDRVEQNQFIGLSGNTGRSTGPHLHLSLFFKNEVLDVERLFQ